MKKTITFLAHVLAISTMQAQTIVADFETFTLSANSFYKDTNSLPFQTINASFDYEWTKGQFPYWSGGTSYTNVKDSVTGDFNNLYGVKALKGYTNSANYAVVKDEAIIRVKSPYTIVEGFYYTNTTFAYKSIKDGDQFARKFGDTTGTKSGTSIPQGSYPDYFKVIVKGYKNGVMNSDSSQFFLADFRYSNSAQDYIVKDWRWVNTAHLGEVDSLKFFMYSSDKGAFGINTPLFFGIDDFTSSVPTNVGLKEKLNTLDLNVYPNPFNSVITISNNSNEIVTIKLTDISGKVIREERLTTKDTSLDLGAIDTGIYFLELSSGEKISVKKIIKN